jgi:hypothetical protein
MRPRKEPLMLTCPNAVVEAVNAKTNRPEKIDSKKRNFIMLSPSRKPDTAEMDYRFAKAG